MIQVVMTDGYYNPKYPDSILQFATFTETEAYIRGYADHKFLGVWHELIIAGGRISVIAHEEGQRYVVQVGTYADV